MLRMTGLADFFTRSEIKELGAEIRHTGHATPRCVFSVGVSKKAPRQRKPRFPGMPLQLRLVEGMFF
jgi:hypothetical protein